MKRFSPQVLIMNVLMAFMISATFAQPVADFTASKTSGCAPLVVTFQNLSSGASAWEWHTGISTTNLKTPTVLYSSPGVYPVTLIAYNPQGGSDTVVKSTFITVYASPTADFSTSVTEACAHTNIQFTSLSSPGDGTITQWMWDFGDGNNSTVQNPVHAYSKKGLYPVSLQVTNSYGCTGSILKSGELDIDAPEAGFFTSNPVACGAPLSVDFTPLQAAGLTHQWQFGDGGTSSVAAPTYVYQTTGSFDVAHIVEDASGCRDTLVKESLVNLGANTLSAYVEDSLLCTGDSVYFTAIAPASSVVAWDFGDGGSMTGIHPGYVYSQPGSYTVTVDISDGAGCQVTRQIPVEVSQTPTVDFGVQDTTVGCGVPFTVDFVNNSTGAISYYWLFFDGPGSTSSSTNPSHTYTTADSFAVKLFGIGASGCTAEKSIKDYIKIKPAEPGFKASKLTGCVPLTTIFTDTTKSYYPIVDWQWDFGDGSTGTGQVASHTYTATGTYDVQLITTTSQGCQDTVVTQQMIQVGTKPTASFHADTTKACALGEVNFINTSTNATSYVWYFGDGDTAMSVNPAHGFAALGPMDVVLVAVNQGCTDTLFRPMYIDVLAPLPVIGMTGRYLCKVPETVNFINLSLGDDAWQWTLPDGSTTLDSITSYSFTQPGSYPVSLMVTNFTTGCQVEITDSVYVKPIEANFSLTTDAGCAPLTVSFQDSSAGAIDWSWDFGGGATSTLPDPVFVYKSPAYHSVSLTVENYYGCKDTKTVDSIRVSRVLPKISVASPIKGCAPLTVDFVDATTEFGSLSLSWLWEFGDGTISTLQNPTHTFQNPGIYTVKLTVTNDLGCSRTATFTQEIQASNPVADFIVQPGITCPEAPVTLVSTSSGSGLTYQWNFGDGGSSSMANPSRAYATPGFYDISLTITDTYGCTKTVTKTNAVQVAELYASFVADTTFASCPPLAVNFDAVDQFPHSGIFYQWDFGNGATGNSPDPSHVYTQPGHFDVQLIVGTPNGCRDTLVRPAYIQIEGPSASFVFDPGQGCPGTEIDFQAVSPDTVTYQWIYGDGSTGSGSSSSHIYDDPGLYLPVLVIEDQDGCTVFSYARDSIEIFTPPVAAFGPASTEACDSMTVSFFDQSQGNPVAWSWEFSDGTTAAVQHPARSFYLPGSYSAKLVVTDVHGCSDSLWQTNVVTIHESPEPMIMGSLADGCSPVSVALQGSGNGHPAVIQSWNWSSGGQQTTGQTWNPTFVQPGIHSINLEAIDQYGCSGTTTTYLEVYPNPVADFAVNDQESCAPATLTFSDLSTGPAIRWNWEFGDGTNSQVKNPVHVYNQDAVYDVSLRVENVYGCADSITKADFIHLNHPVADFDVSDQSGCPGTLFSFTDLSGGLRPVQGWTWDFGDGNSATGDQVTHRFANSGDYAVTLIVTDSEGCQDTIVIPQPISVIEDDPAIPMQMDVASVISDGEVLLSYEPYNNRRDDFGRYLIFRSEDGVTYHLADSVANMQQTTYVDQGLDTRSHRYWYKVVPENTCLNPAPWDSMTAHATIQLTAWPGLDEATLTWEGYEGWETIDKYEVYRVTGYASTEKTLLGETSGTTTSFVDPDFRCDENYSYRVVAIQGTLTAGSDSSFTDPLHLGPDDPTHTIRATVENNQSVLVEWEDPQIERAERVVVERRDGGNYQVISEMPYTAGAGKVSDANVEVTERSYTYRVVTIDSCGDATPVGLEGTTILLQADREFSGTQLTWSPYLGWEGGVEGYTLEVFDEAAQTFRVVTQLDGQTTSFFDQKTEMNQPTYCYRITAWEYGGYQATSQSNEACVQPEPYLYVGNAFTPNGDGYNDEFRIGMAFIGNVNLEVYNRWGKKVFESNSLDTTWNGMTQSGAPAPEGVYVFKIQAVGYNGTTVTRNGTVTLLR